MGTPTFGIVSSFCSIIPHHKEKINTKIKNHSDLHAFAVFSQKGKFMKKKLLCAVGTLALTGITAFIAYHKGHTDGFIDGLTAADSPSDIDETIETEEEE
jgi:hypothetical protein